MSELTAVSAALPVSYFPRKNVGCGVAELDPPSVSSLLLQRLGDITMFCCADRSTVCEEEPVVESIMLMKGSKKVVIVDTHADAVRCDSAPGSCPCLRG
jgi:hypothetical protein